MRSISPRAAGATSTPSTDQAEATPEGVEVDNLFLNRRTWAILSFGPSKRRSHRGKPGRRRKRPREAAFVKFSAISP
jgi:hypothetical protein